MNIKIIAAIAVVLALVGAGWYVNGLRAAKAELQNQVTQLEADTDQLRLFMARDRQALDEAQKKASAASKRASEASKGISNAYKNDPTARAWADVPLPPGLLDSIK